MTDNEKSTRDVLSELNELSKTTTFTPEEQAELNEIYNLVKEIYPSDSDAFSSKSEEKTPGIQSSKVKSLGSIGGNKTHSSLSTGEQIYYSFISCLVLSGVTAAMGTGWILYIVNQII